MKTPQYTIFQSSLFRHCQNFYRARDGVATIEFAFIAPAMVVMLLGLLDYGIATFHTMELESAARSGSQYAMLASNNTSLITTTVQNSTNLNTANLTVTVSEFCECSNGSSVACSGGTCSSGSVRTYMTIATSYTHTPMFIPGTMTLTGDSTIRTQ